MMRLVTIIVLLALVCACNTPTNMSVDSNIRMPGEAETINRQLTHEERSEVVAAISSTQPTDEFATRRPLISAGETGRWNEVNIIAMHAAKACEMAVIDAKQIPNGMLYNIRSLTDETGTLTVMGNQQQGVTSVQARIGYFDQDQAKANAIQDSFWKELHRYARIPRPQD